ncbi:S66 family peptidase [Clostridium gasigenes]|uniref:S66 family peptidase n=1 Tax=Clostridium gasigenes TaxID=94869 RepID=UPI001C0CF986|nr:S66 peptidase family protein [Clostridium gasigenes]MBU3104172.1 LD-carboxypeptidase [Clostridium gasigenes]
MNSLLKFGDTIGIIACSNGLSEEASRKIDYLEEKLSSININVLYAKTLYKKHSIFNGSAKERANELMNLFINPNVKAIFDVSGGDLANSVLDYLDFNIIKTNFKPFFGYSDLSVLLNGIYAKTGLKTYNYQLRNLVGNCEEKQLQDFTKSLIENKKDLYNFEYTWVQGTSMEGVVVGGNIRCVLKLAGTEYMPDFQDKILFLESLGGDVGKMTTYLTQYKQLGVFKKVKGILLGSFTEMEREKYTPDIIEIITSIIEDPNLPIAKTNQIGHGQDSKCIVIGEHQSF